MILSSSYEVTVFLLAVAMLCWGLWANTLKIAGKWRFELYYLDFSAGFLLLAVIAALTLGSIKSGELTFQDNFAIAAYRKMAYCLVAGFLFGLANYLLAAGVALAGMAVAFTVSLGIGLVTSVVLGLFSGAHGPLALLGVGCAVVIAAVLIAAYAHNARADAADKKLDRAAFRPDPRELRARKQPAPTPAGRAIIISVISGLVMGIFPAVLRMGQVDDDGVGPYGAALLFAVGTVGAALFFTPVFWNFPVMGRALRVRDYLKSTLGNHLMGVAGGVLAGVGVLASYVAAAASSGKQAGAFLAFSLNHAGVLVAALCGLLVWNEFRSAESRTVLLFGAAIVLFALGIAMVALGQA